MAVLFIKETKAGVEPAICSPSAVIASFAELIQTDLNKYKYEIFSVYVEVSDWEYYNKMKFNTKNEYYNHILKLKNKSMYDTNVLVNNGVYKKHSLFLLPVPTTFIISFLNLS